MRERQLIFATTNPGKLSEAQTVAQSFSVTLVGLDQLAGERQVTVPQVVEGAGSYYGNAVLKARTYAKWIGLPVIADDTGLELDVLGGLPGVFTARFGVDRVRQQLGQIRSSEAAFVCCVAYAEPGGRSVSVTKILKGLFTVAGMAERSDGPLPYSELFVPHGETTTLSQLLRAKSYLSHRGRALSALFRATFLATGQE